MNKVHCPAGCPLRHFATLEFNVQLSTHSGEVDINSAFVLTRNSMAGCYPVHDRWEVCHLRLQLERSDSGTVQPTSYISNKRPQAQGSVASDRRLSADPPRTREKHAFSAIANPLSPESLVCIISTCPPADTKLLRLQPFKHEFEAWGHRGRSPILPNRWISQFRSTKGGWRVKSYRFHSIRIKL